MFKAIDPQAVKPYVSPSDPDEQNPTTFLIGRLDPALRDHIDIKCMNMEMSGSDKKNTTRKLKMNTLQHATLLVQFGLRGVENFLDAEGKPVNITLGQTSINGKSYPTFPLEIIASFGVSLVEELAGVIYSEQQLSGEEIKN